MLQHLDQNGWAIVFAIVGPLVVALVKYFARPKATVSYMVIAENYFPVLLTATEVNTLVCTRTMVIRNTGRKEATNIEVSHAIPPTVFRLLPPTESDAQRDSTGFHFIKLKRLPARSQVVLETLTERDMPILMGVTHDTGTARRFTVAWNQQFPWYFNLFAVWLFVLGLVVTIYGVARLLLAGASAVGWI